MGIPGLMGKQARKIANIQQDLREVAETEAGKRMLVWLRHEICCADETTYDPALGAASTLKEGRRSVYLAIQDYLSRDTAEMIRQADLHDQQLETQERLQGDSGLDI